MFYDRGRTAQLQGAAPTGALTLRLKVIERLGRPRLIGRSADLVRWAQNAWRPHMSPEDGLRAARLTDFHRVDVKVALVGIIISGGWLASAQVRLWCLSLCQICVRGPGCAWRSRPRLAELRPVAAFPRCVFFELLVCGADAEAANAPLTFRCLGRKQQLQESQQANNDWFERVNAPSNPRANHWLANFSELPLQQRRESSNNRERESFGCAQPAAWFD